VSRGGRWLAAAAVALASLAVAALGGIGWYYSGEILGPDRPPTLEEQQVLAAGPGQVTLSRDAESMLPGVWALEWQGGYGRVGDILADEGPGVTRVFTPLAGTPPVGGRASLRGVARAADPLTWSGLPFEEVRLAGPLGEQPAWWVPGPDSTWVIYVHGRGAGRSEALRTLGVLARRGLPGLLITYRNDAGAPATPDGRYRLGQEEWRDVEPAVRWALDHGARDVVLSGYSMGGQIVARFLADSPLAVHVRAAVLEAPVLDWNTTLAMQTRKRGLPLFLLAAGKWVTTARAGIDWGGLDRVAHADAIRAPLLILHDENDRWTPFAVSEAMARALPGQVTLVPTRGGNHVESWNADPPRYAEAVDRWCDAERIGKGPTT
jgi:hypothetical protein